VEAQELFKKVRKIEIKTRGLSNQIFSGEYHSVFKGRGMAFSEVREYQFGDDIRNIDWNVTARFNHPFVKIFEEELSKKEDEFLNSIIPDSSHIPYDMHEVIARIVDNSEFLEVQRYFAPNIICGFARMDGRSVGIVANQPKYLQYQYI